MPLSDVERAHRYLRLASTLCYVQCVFLALSTFALGIPLFSKGPPPIAGYLVLVLFVAATVGFGVSGRLLRSFLKTGAYLALAIIAVELALRLLLVGSLLNIWLAVDVGIVALVGLSWKHLQSATTVVSPPAT